MERVQVVTSHVNAGSVAGGGGPFEIVDGEFDGSAVKQLRNTETGEFAEILLAGKGGAVSGRDGGGGRRWNGGGRW